LVYNSPDTAIGQAKMAAPEIFDLNGQQRTDIMNVFFMHKGNAVFPVFCLFGAAIFSFLFFVCFCLLELFGSFSF
jgi:hypothetical protein